MVNVWLRKKNNSDMQANQHIKMSGLKKKKTKKQKKQQHAG